MQIQLKQSEIETAITNYISNLGINLKGRNITIGFTSGRQPNGLTADIDISEVGESATFYVEAAEKASEKVPAPASLKVVQESDEPKQEPEDPAPAPKTGTSLFGG